MRKIFLTLGACTLLLFSIPVFAHDNAAHGHTWGPADHDTVMHVFVRDGCPHCAALEEFMDEWFKAGGAPSVTYYEVMNRESQELFAEVQERMPGLSQGVPTIILDGQVMQGYETATTTGKQIQKIYEECTDREGSCITLEKFLAGEGAKTIGAKTHTCSGDPAEPCEIDEDAERFVFDFWFVGRTDLRDLSLPALSLILGGLDGFNPCAMWVLISLLTLLINTRSWTKIIVIGGTFLLVSGVMYYLFIAAWLNVFLLLGFNQIIQKIIGIVAIGGGSFYLYEAFGKDPNQCKVTNLGQRQKTIERMKKVLSASSWPLMVGGVAILAASVNLVELVCTAGLPAIFTAILAQNALTTVEHYWYLLLYILAYMFDDLIIYTIAIGSLHATGFTTKYRRFTLVFGGVLMATLGVLLIFFPEVLTFE